MCKVSIIVPIYNIKQYLPRCIDSIRNQTMGDIEIILVDDGSSDGSSELCDQYASADPRIRVLHKENEGLSAARNDGIQMARADYIMFVDGDDWVEPKFCELPYRAAIENNVEIVIFLHISVLTNGKKIKHASQGEGLLAKGDISALKQIRVNAWGKLYHKKLFNTIHYPVGHVYEDVATTHRVLYSADGIYSLNQHLYNYSTNRPGSITETADSETLRDLLWALSLRHQDFGDWGVDTSDELCNVALNCLIKYGRKTDLSSHWAEMLSQDKHLTKDASWKKNVVFSIYRFCPLLFDLVCIIFKRRKREMTNTRQQY